MKPKFKIKKVPFHYQDLERYTKAKRYENPAIRILRILDTGYDGKRIFINAVASFGKNKDSYIMLVISDKAFDVMLKKIKKKIDFRMIENGN